MTNRPMPSTLAFPLAAQKMVDQRCNQFELAWKQGKRPGIEDFLNDLGEAERQVLLLELIYLDVAYRCRQGEHPTEEEYLVRFAPLDADLVRKVLEDAFTSGATVHSGSGKVRVKPPSENTVAPQEGVRIRCPHCHNPIQLTDRQPDEVLCPGCGSSFRVHDSRPTSTIAAMKPLGKFELLERVGLGAFGAVWRARDTELDRIVALKIPHTGLLSSHADAERFHREARSAAQLRHPGIVTVHEVAILDGLPILVADFIQGVPLKDYLESHHPTFAETAALVGHIAEALDYAHSMNVIHRDIKPANIMLELSKTGDKSTTALVPRILDFGLALRGDAEITLTVDGQILGTPAYMSPEQASGKGHQVDPRTDLYSLGVVLYETLCGELPFRGSRMMILHQVLHEEPRPPRRINDKIPRDLETICLKCLEKDPAKRYLRARDLVDDLERFRQGIPIKARPVGAAERLVRWCRRNPLVASLSALLALVLVGSLAATTGLWLRAEHDRTLAEDRLKFAKTLWIDADLGMEQTVGPEGLQLSGSLIQRGHVVKLEAGKFYGIDLDSDRYTTHLLVLDPKKGIVDQGRRVSFLAPTTEAYKLVVTFIQPGLGKYTLTVREEEPYFASKDGITIAGTLQAKDAKDRAQGNCVAKIYHVKMLQGRRYMIQMESTDLDAFLRVENQNRLELARDDDSGGALNARIMFQALKDDFYRIIATSAEPALGSFTLTVREVDASEQTETPKASAEPRGKP